MTIHFNSLHEELTTLIKRSNYALDFYSPFVSISALEKLMAEKPPKSVVSLVTTWRLEDLVSGISDIKLYSFCKSHGIYLFLNQRLHLKSYLADYKTLVTGSANLTQKGMGLVSQCNYETLVGIESPSQEYLVHLSKIKRDAILVNDEVVANFQSLVALKAPKIKPTLDELQHLQEEIDRTLIAQKHFLISALPMSRSIDELYEVLTGKDFDDYEILASARHDIANYELNDRRYSNAIEFRQALTQKFFSHPFISALCGFISEPKRFGAIKEWVQNNCTDVPVPSRRDLTGNVQVLYNWLVDLGADRFERSRPNHSEIISPKQPGTSKGMKG